MFTHNDIPQYIQTDRSTNFPKMFFTKVLNKLNINHIKSSSYQTESQGGLERSHQTIKTLKLKYYVEHESDWDEFLFYTYYLQYVKPKRNIYDFLSSRCYLVAKCSKISC